jgi:hypothetical protein
MFIEAASITALVLLSTDGSNDNIQTLNFRFTFGVQ